MPGSISCSVLDSPHRRRLVDHVRERLFTAARPGAAPGVGAEVELIPLFADDGRPVPIHDDDTGPGLLGFLRHHGRDRGWASRPGPHGVSTVLVPGGGVLSFEPGGQLEYATAPHGSAADLVADLDRVVPPLVDAAAGAGVRLVAAGIDPINPLDRARLLLRDDRYAAMHRYLAPIGDAGPRMMLQTAAVQVNVELGPPDQADLRWRVLNAAAPCITALFANSPAYAGERTGFASFRARQWRLLDRRRTGLLAREADGPSEYTDFGLAAGWIFAPSHREPEPFVEWLLRGEVTLEDWRRHLTTLFPEIRPRGFLEVRGIDALAPRWYAAPIALLTGLLADRATLGLASDIVGQPDSALLQDAARGGMGDPRIAEPAATLFRLALDACERTGAVTGAPLATAWEYFERYAARSRAPADDEVSAAA